MAFLLPFDRLVDYDRGQAGISLTIDVRLGQSSLSVPVKIGTSSTHCLSTNAVVRQLGIDVETGERITVSTVTGSFQAFGHSVTLVFQEFEFDSTVLFASEDATVRNVLGRHGWLDRMIIGINDYDGKLYLRPYDIQ